MGKNQNKVNKLHAREYIVFDSLNLKAFLCRHQNSTKWNQIQVKIM